MFDTNKQSDASLSCTFCNANMLMIRVIREFTMLKLKYCWRHW